MKRESNVVDLIGYKRQKQERELDELKSSIDRIMREKGIEPQVPGYVHPDQCSDMVYTAGTYSLQGTQFTLLDCLSNLNWVSSILMSIGHFEAANKIDNVAVQLCNEMEEQ